jgi:prepilin-type N-terminal cleavage/methylation domain-containing protein
MKQKCNEQGFTLIEVIIAMAILSIGILSLYSMQSTAIRGNASANYMTRAATVASETVEQLMDLDFSDPILAPAVAPSPHTSTELPTLHLPKPVSTVTWEIVDWSGDAVDNDIDGETDETDEDNMKHINITVNYVVGTQNKQLFVSFLKTRLL